jgi:hypothetical protein
VYTVTTSGAATPDGVPVVADSRAFMSTRGTDDALIFYESPSMITVASFGGGISGADTYCTSIAPPGGHPAKALLGASTRFACSVANCATGNTQLDWVFQPNIQYVNPNGSYLFRTDGNGLNQAPLANTLQGLGDNFWDGMASDWTVQASQNCSDWTDGTSTASAAVGWDGNTGASDWLMGGSLTCGLSATGLRCVEQP